VRCREREWRENGAFGSGWVVRERVWCFGLLQIPIELS
jgi:hypothetical protein